MSVFDLRNAIRDSTLERREYTIASTAASYDDGDGIVTISRETLEEKSRYSRTEVFEACKVLKKLGWMETIKHPTRPRAKAFKLSIGRNPQTSENRTTGAIEKSENRTPQTSENRTSPKTGRVGGAETSENRTTEADMSENRTSQNNDTSEDRTRNVRKPDNSPTPPKKEEQTKEQTRASQQAARTHETPPAPAKTPPSELLARSLPSVDFPDKPGPPTADFDADLVAETRREWNEAHEAANITRRFAMGTRWVQTHFGPLTDEQKDEVWMGFRRKLLDGELAAPERWLKAACLGKAKDERDAKVVQMPRKRKPPQPSSLSDYSHYDAETIAILTGQKRGAS